MIEPRQEPGRYDQESFLALHDWDGRLLATDDGAMNPSYGLSTINDRLSGAGEPLGVREGQRIVLHVPNSSPTEVHWISRSGHSLGAETLDADATELFRHILRERNSR